MNSSPRSHRVKFTWKIQTLNPGAACPCNGDGAKALQSPGQAQDPDTAGGQLPRFLSGGADADLPKLWAEAQPMLLWLPTPTVHTITAVPQNGDTFPSQ